MPANFAPRDDALNAFLSAIDIQAYDKTRNHFAGDAIFTDMRPGIAGIRYQQSLPDDIRAGRTGLPAIDPAVAALYKTGYFHNHARMWLDSDVVHLHKVHWRVAADWLYGHLLDGDLAANHLSWQWVAATFSNKPYLFNAENIAKFAPAVWHCRGSVLDMSYEALEQLARTQTVLEPVKLKALFGMPSAQPANQGISKAQSLTARAPLDAGRYQLRWLAPGCHPSHLPQLCSELQDVQRAFANPVEPCRSFSAFWSASAKSKPDAQPRA